MKQKTCRGKAPKNNLSEVVAWFTTEYNRENDFVFKYKDELCAPKKETFPQAAASQEEEEPSILGRYCPDIKQESMSGEKISIDGGSGRMKQFQNTGENTENIRTDRGTKTKRSITEDNNAEDGNAEEVYQRSLAERRKLTMEYIDMKDSGIYAEDELKKKKDRIDVLKGVLDRYGPQPKVTPVPRKAETGGEVVDLHTQKTPGHSEGKKDTTTRMDGGTKDLEKWNSGVFEWDRKVEKALQQIFKNKSFRENQRGAINAALAREDVFVIMPTGGGKSLCFQLPAVIGRGVTVVVTPLLSLMQDQIKNMVGKRVVALGLNSTLTKKEVELSYTELCTEKPSCKLFYVTPELVMSSNRFQDVLENLYSRRLIERFVIDEAHCVRQWGAEFRKEYGELRKLREQYADVPIMALTATATKSVQEDVIASLGIAGCTRFWQSYNRKNLSYAVYPKTGDVEQDIVAFINSSFPGKSGVIYCTAKADCEDLAQSLCVKYRLKARFYHAGLEAGDRETVQREWTTNAVQIIVATIAFGMGIDKPDVRFVIHYSMPKNLEGYYQETGRAGRDGLESSCVMYYSYGDKKRFDFMIQKSEGSASQKSIEMENARRVLAYSLNRIDCRRVILMEYFGEKFDRAMCGKTCDNCERGGKLALTDFTSQAREIAQFVKGTQDRLTMNNLVNIYRGVSGGKEKKHRLCSIFSRGRMYTREEGERLIQHMIKEDILVEYLTTNNGGYCHSYIGPSKGIGSCLSGNKKLMMVTGEHVPVVPRPKKQAGPAGGAKTKTTAWGKKKMPFRKKKPNNFGFK
ncbi:MAG: RecQ family ATP-dependent DNA helicase [Amphiamblys sp. WSBS2006]|nr:MAG: RecQ family ATP-dependent DNA helicase [Amphiamblys sp. WSBS2006]